VIAEMAKSGAGRHFNAIEPVVHGGSFIVSILASILVHDLQRASDWRGNAAVFFICSATVLSDRLFIFCFVVPALLALLILEPRYRRIVSLIGSILLGTTVGWFLSDLLPNQQPALSIEFSKITTRAVLFVRQLDVSIIVGTTAPATVFCVVVPILYRRRGERASFYWVIWHNLYCGDNSFGSWVLVRGSRLVSIPRPVDVVADHFWDHSYQSSLYALSRRVGALRMVKPCCAGRAGASHWRHAKWFVVAHRRFRLYFRS
jgi:hypothetical protein